MNYEGFDGFLGTRGDFMIDFVFLAMFAVVPVLAYSIYVVRVKHDYVRHKQVQVGLVSVLLVAVTLFEIDVRVFDWTLRAQESPHYAPEPGGILWNPFRSAETGLMWRVLSVHLYFAVSTVILWIVVMVRAFRNFPKPPHPDRHSRSHVFWARIAAVDMVCTAVSGNTFYVLAFAAT